MPHIHEHIDFCSEVYIVYKDKVLLRMHDKYRLWLSVGGHIELNEDPSEAAVREVKEEVGLDVMLLPNPNHMIPVDNNIPGWKSIIPPQFVFRHRVNDQHEHVVFIFFALADTDKFELPDDEKTDGCRWFTAEELKDPTYHLVPNVAFCAERALNEYV